MASEYGRKADHEDEEALGPPGHTPERRVARSWDGTTIGAVIDRKTNPAEQSRSQLNKTESAEPKPAPAT
jgi:hypothetical protein